MQRSAAARDATVIERYSFGLVVVEGATYTEDVLILPDHEVRPWRRKQGHLLQLEDLAEALAARPEVLIVGTGSQEQMKVADEVRARMRELEIELLAFDTRTACRMYNDVVGRRRAVAALHLTC